MKIFAKLFVVALACCSIGAVEASIINNAQTEVVTAYQNWCNAIGSAKGNPASVVKFYAPNAILLPTLSATALINRNGGLNAYFATLTSYQGIQCTPKQLHTQIDNGVAVNTGLYTISYTDNNGNKESTPIRFTFIYKKFNGTWLIIKQHTSYIS